MPASFSRTLRSLEADRSRGGLVAIGVGLVLLSLWTIWFVFAEISVYEISQSARIEAIAASSAAVLVVGEFDPDRALGRILPGQRAELRLNGLAAARRRRLRATIVGVAPAAKNGTLRVEARLDESEPLPFASRSGSAGVLEVEVERVAPVTLVLRAASGRAY